MASIYKHIIAILFILLLFFSLPGTQIHDEVKKGNLQKVKNMVINVPSLVFERDERGNTPLLSASKRENLELFNFLIEQNSELNESNKSGYTALHYAAYYNQIENLVALLRHGVRIDPRSLEDETPLHMTAYSGSPVPAMILIKKGASIEAKEKRGRTPLILTARESGNIKIVNMLIAAGADINAADNSGHSALSLSAWRGYADLVNLLLNNKAEIPRSEKIKRKILKYSLKKKLDRLFQKLISRSFSPQELKKSFPALMNEAVAGGSREIVKTLLKNGFRLDFKDSISWSPIHYAAEFDRVEMGEFLISNGVDINALTMIGETPFNIAERRGNLNMIALLEKLEAVKSRPHFPELNGKYLGQKFPEDEAILFAPAIVGGSYQLHSSIVFSPDEKEAYWSVMIPPKDLGYGLCKIMGSKMVKGKWTYPEFPVFSDGDVPVFSFEGEKIYFMSKRPGRKNGKRGKENIWCSVKNGSGWHEPVLLSREPAKYPFYWQFSMDKRSNLIFGAGDGRILYVDSSREICDPVPVLTVEDQSLSGGSPFISPDGDYLIYMQKKDLYISFRKSEKWSIPERLPDSINSEFTENCPIVSTDGKFLFFLSNKTGGSRQYWIRIKGIIEEYRNSSEAVQ